MLKIPLGTGEFFDVVCVDNYVYLKYDDIAGVARMGQFKDRDPYLVPGKTYKARDKYRDYYVVIDESGESFLYPKAMFRRREAF